VHRLVPEDRSKSIEGITAGSDDGSVALKLIRDDR
jgi:hypothetical protein